MKIWHGDVIFRLFGGVLGILAPIWVGLAGLKAGLENGPARPPKDSVFYGFRS